MIRKAEIADLPRMEATAHEFYAASQHLRGFDISRFVQVWTGLLESGAGVIFLAVDGDEIQGAIGGVAYPDIYSGALIGTEFFWFLRPSHRGGGMRLYFQFEKWAREKGCSAVRMVRLSDSMPEQLDRVYERLGFTEIERHFSKEL